MSDDKLLAGSTNVIEVVGVVDTVTNQYPSDATVTCDILDDAGQLVPGASAVAMPYVGGTTGALTTYRGIIPASAALVAGRRYTRRYSFVGAGGIGSRKFETEIVATAE